MAEKKPNGWMKIDVKRFFVAMGSSLSPERLAAVLYQRDRTSCQAFSRYVQEIYDAKAGEMSSDEFAALAGAILEDHVVAVHTAKTVHDAQCASAWHIYSQKGTA